VSGPLQQVHLRFNDAAGKPTAVRVRVTDASGAYHAPFGRLTCFATESGVDVGANVLLDDGPWAIIDGACEIALPPGPLKIQARKGPEFKPFDEDIVLHPGKMSLRFVMERWTDRAADGWHAGDICAYEMSPHAALLEAMAQDLAVVDLLVREQPGSIVNISAYSGQQPALAKPGHMIAVNTANQSPQGRLLLLNTHRTVYPLSFQVGEKWSLIDWCDQAHRKKGLVIAEDWLLRLANGPVPELVDADFLRRVDAIRFHPHVPLEPWFAAQARGFKLPLVAGSGKESNRGLLGAWRTYVHVPGPLDYASWIEALRAGRSFVTNGPIFTRLSGGAVEATCATPLERLQVFMDGRAIAETVGPSTTLRVAASNATHARCEGAGGLLAVGQVHGGVGL
jgi:hypothetical protein